MLSKVKPLLPYALSLLAFSSIAVCAESDDRGWFVGGTLGNGQAELSMEATFFEDALFADTDESGFLFGPFAGFNFNENFGLEGQILDGSYGDNDVFTLSVKPRFTFPLSPTLALFVRAGLESMIFTDEDFDDESFGGVIPSIGVGARIALVNQVRLNLAIDYASGELEYDEDSFLDGTDVDIDQVTGSLSVYYQF